MLKLILSSFISVLLLLATIIIAWPDNQLRIIVCDVGQGDAILITKGFYQILIDGGPSDAVLDCLGRHLSFWDRSIDVILATHSDKDHISGLPSVIDKFRVGVILLEPAGKITSDFLSLRDKIIKAQIRHFFPQTGDRVMVGDKKDQIELLVLWPEKVVGNMQVLNNDLPQEEVKKMLISDEIDDDEMNAQSITVILLYNSLEVLLTGDLDQKSELAMIDKGLLQDVDILKIAHHGSKSSTSAKFLEVVKPEISLISSGRKNPYGHPHQEVIERLLEVGGGSNIVYNTAELGDIVVVSDGGRYWLEKNRDLEKININQSE